MPLQIVLFGDFDLVVPLPGVCKYWINFDSFFLCFGINPEYACLKNTEEVDSYIIYTIWTGVPVGVLNS